MKYSVSYAATRHLGNIPCAHHKGATVCPLYAGLAVAVRRQHGAGLVVGSAGHRHDQTSNTFIPSPLVLALPSALRFAILLATDMINTNALFSDRLSLPFCLHSASPPRHGLPSSSATSPTFAPAAIGNNDRQRLNSQREASENAQTVPRPAPPSLEATCQTPVLAEASRGSSPNAVATCLTRPKTRPLGPKLATLWRARLSV